LAIAAPTTRNTGKWHELTDLLYPHDSRTHFPPGSGFFVFPKPMTPLPETRPPLPVISKNFRAASLLSPDQSANVRTKSRGRPIRFAPELLFRWRRARGTTVCVLLRTEAVVRPHRGWPQRFQKLFERAPAVVPRPDRAAPYRISLLPAGGQCPAGAGFMPAKPAGAGGKGAGSRKRQRWKRAEPCTLPLSACSMPESFHPAVNEGGRRRNLPPPSDLSRGSICQHHASLP
jgi:hypothetical protein